MSEIVSYVCEKVWGLQQWHAIYLYKRSCSNCSYLEHKNTVCKL